MLQNPLHLQLPQCVVRPPLHFTEQWDQHQLFCFELQVTDSNPNRLKSKENGWTHRTRSPEVRHEPSLVSSVAQHSHSDYGTPCPSRSRLWVSLYHWLTALTTTSLVWSQLCRAAFLTASWHLLHFQDSCSTRGSPPRSRAVLSSYVTVLLVSALPFRFQAQWGKEKSFFVHCWFSTACYSNTCPVLINNSFFQYLEAQGLQ